MPYAVLYTSCLAVASVPSHEPSCTMFNVGLDGLQQGVLCLITVLMPEGKKIAVP